MVDFFGIFFYFNSLEKVVKSLFILLDILIIDTHTVISTHNASEARSTFIYFAEYLGVFSP